MGRGRGGMCTKMRSGNRPRNLAVVTASDKMSETAFHKNEQSSCAPVDAQYILDIQAKYDALRKAAVKGRKKNSKNSKKGSLTFVEDSLKEVKEKIVMLENEMKDINKLHFDNKAFMDGKEALEKHYENIKCTELDVPPIDMAALKDVALELDIEPKNTNERKKKKNRVSRFFSSIKEKFTTKSEPKVKNTSNESKAAKKYSKSEGHLFEKKEIDTFSVEAAVGGGNNVHDDIDEPAAYPEKSIPSKLTPEDKQKLDQIQYAFVDKFVSRTIADALRVVKQEKDAEEIQAAVLAKIKTSFLSKSLDSHLDMISHVCVDTSMDMAMDELMFEAYFAKKDPINSFNPAYVN